LNKSRYIVYRNKLKSLLFKAENEYYRSKFRSIEGNSRKTWQLLREVMHISKNVNVVNKFTADDESIITNRQEIVDHFNDYVVNIGSKLAASIPPSTTLLVTFQSDKHFFIHSLFFQHMLMKLFKLLMHYRTKAVSVLIVFQLIL